MYNKSQLGKLSEALLIKSRILNLTVAQKVREYVKERLEQEFNRTKPIQPNITHPPIPHSHVQALHPNKHLADIRAAKTQQMVSASVCDACTNWTNVCGQNIQLSTDMNNICINGSSSSCSGAVYGGPENNTICVQNNFPLFVSDIGGTNFIICQTLNNALILIWNGFNASINLIANGYSFIASDNIGNSDHVTGCLQYDASIYDDNITVTNFTNGNFGGADGNDIIIATKTNNVWFSGDYGNDIIISTDCNLGFLTGFYGNDTIIATNCVDIIGYGGGGSDNITVINEINGAFFGDADDDILTAINCTGTFFYGGWGKDNITIMGSSFILLDVPGQTGSNHITVNVTFGSNLIWYQNSASQEIYSKSIAPSALHFWEIAGPSSFHTAFGNYYILSSPGSQFYIGNASPDNNVTIIEFNETGTDGFHSSCPVRSYTQISDPLVSFSFPSPNYGAPVQSCLVRFVCPDMPLVLFNNYTCEKLNFLPPPPETSFSFFSKYPATRMLCASQQLYESVNGSLVSISQALYEDLQGLISGLNTDCCLDTLQAISTFKLECDASNFPNLGNLIIGHCYVNLICNELCHQITIAG